MPVDQIPIGEQTPIENLIELYKLGLEMMEVCVQEQGKGLSAVQVGVPYDLFVVRHLPNNLRVGNDSGMFLRCSYTAIGDADKVDSREGCLSLRAADGSFLVYKVKRYPKIRVRGLRLIDEPELRIIEVDHILDLKHDAIVFQHEIDHSAGTLISQIGEEILVW